MKSNCSNHDIINAHRKCKPEIWLRHWAWRISPSVLTIMKNRIYHAYLMYFKVKRYKVTYKCRWDLQILKYRNTYRCWNQIPSRYIHYTERQHLLGPLGLHPCKSYLLVPQFWCSLCLMASREPDPKSMWTKLRCCLWSLFLRPVFGINLNNIISSNVTLFSIIKILKG